jgi:hypothetical protein
VCSWSGRAAAAEERANSQKLRGVQGNKSTLSPTVISTALSAAAPHNATCRTNAHLRKRTFARRLTRLLREHTCAHHFLSQTHAVSASCLLSACLPVHSRVGYPLLWCPLAPWLLSSLPRALIHSTADPAGCRYSRSSSRSSSHAHPALSSGVTLCFIYPLHLSFCAYTWSHARPGKDRRRGAQRIGIL